MKKRRNLLFILLVIGATLLPTIGHADDSLTAQQKYDALKEKGIFAGMDGEAAQLDNNMNRAQFARVAALILGLEGIGDNNTKVVTEKPFDDVELDYYFVNEIAAAKEAGIMIGNGDGTFNPNSDITVQELAVTMVRTLGLEPIEDAKVIGAADWAAGYIQALLNIGILLPTNYTEPTTRSVLIETSYATNDILMERQEAERREAEEKEAEETEAEESASNPIIAPPPATLSIVSTKQVGARKLNVKLNRIVNPATVSFSVTRSGYPVEVQAVPDPLNRYDFNLSFADNLLEGDYIVTASYTDPKSDISSVNVTAAAERIVKLEFASLDTLAKGSEVDILLKAFNQFGEEMQPQSGLEVNSSVPATIDYHRMVVILDTSSYAQNDLPVTVIDQGNYVTVYRVFIVEEEAPVQILETPTADPAGGVLALGTQVSLDAADGATIYYTTDGSTPSRTNGFEYSEPIIVNYEMTMKAIAVQNGWEDSDILTASYTVTAEVSPLDFINEASAPPYNWDGVDVSTFEEAGIVGVTSDNLFSVQYYLEFSAPPPPRTVGEIQDIVYEVLAGLALTEISNYFTVYDWPMPDTAVFEAAGLTGVTDENLNDILNAILDAYQMIRGPFDPPFSITSKDDLQQVIDEWIALNI